MKRSLSFEFLSGKTFFSSFIGFYSLSEIKKMLKSPMTKSFFFNITSLVVLVVSDLRSERSLVAIDQRLPV